MYRNYFYNTKVLKKKKRRAINVKPGFSIDTSTSASMNGMDVFCFLAYLMMLHHYLSGPAFIQECGIAGS